MKSARTVLAQGDGILAICVGIDTAPTGGNYKKEKINLAVRLRGGKKKVRSLHLFMSTFLLLHMFMIFEMVADKATALSLAHCFLKVWKQVFEVCHNAFLFTLI